MDTWLAYAPVKNNPEDAAKVRKSFGCSLESVLEEYSGGFLKK
jgi:hypothetical protein